MIRLLATLILALAAPVQAMTFVRNGDTLILAGRVDPQDVQTAVLYGSGLTQVVIHDSPGGNMQAALRIAEVIRSSGASTTVKGLCVSACALIFLGGEQRTITSTGAIGLHSSTIDGLRSSNGNREMERFINWRTDNKFPSGLLARALSLTGSSSVVLILANSVHLIDNGRTTDLPAYRTAWHIGITTQPTLNLSVGKAQ